MTHSERSLAARVFGARWPAYCLQHPQLYAPRTLRQAFERAGLQQVNASAHDESIFPRVICSAMHGLFAAGLGERSRAPLPRLVGAGAEARQHRGHRS